LLAPEGTSVNEGIKASLCSIKYTSVDNAVRIIKQLGPGTMLAKLDLKEAYRMVPVHPQDRVLLGMHWKGETYVDAALPFELRSAPKIFSALADALAWIIHANGFPNVLHYLDDFLLLGQPGTQRCTEALVRTLALCGELGVLVAEDKTEGPATSITFLGIEIDTEAFELRLPQHKLRDLKSKLGWWMSKSPGVPHRSGRKRELLSLIGLLNHAATVVKPGRTFLRSQIDASTTVTALDHHVTLTTKARGDIAWWFYWTETWNGVSLFPAAEPGEFIYSDASGSWGCGAVWRREWLQIPWPESWSAHNIALKELAPVVMAVAVWGHRKRAIIQHKK